MTKAQPWVEYREEESVGQTGKESDYSTRYRRANRKERFDGDEEGNGGGPSIGQAGGIENPQEMATRPAQNSEIDGEEQVRQTTGISQGQATKPPDASSRVLSRMLAFETSMEDRFEKILAMMSANLQGSHGNTEENADRRSIYDPRQVADKKKALDSLNEEQKQREFPDNLPFGNMRAFMATPPVAQKQASIKPEKTTAMSQETQKNELPKPEKKTSLAGTSQQIQKRTQLRHKTWPIGTKKNNRRRKMSEVAG